MPKISSPPAKSRSARHHSPAVSDRLLRLVRKRYEDPHAPKLFRLFLEQTTFDPRLAAELIEAAGTPGVDTWETRCAAVLMLEKQILLIPREPLSKSTVVDLLSRLKLISPSGKTVAEYVLSEGYSSTSVLQFFRELLRRLQRLERIHRMICGPETTPSALDEFIQVSRKECKLTLARYLFQPAEITERILQQVRITPGRPERKMARSGILAGLPPLEQAVLKNILAGCQVLWVAGQTSSEINSLVEYPCSTVVLVVKLPGSNWEFEIKRAGVRGNHALNAVYDRDSKLVPTGHRLHGGSVGSSLGFEAEAARHFSAIYYDIHGSLASINMTSAIVSIDTIPSHRGNISLFTYFTEPKYFGEGFQAMRREMRQIVASTADENSEEPLPGPLGLTVDFLSAYAPRQSIIAGSTSFRLERLGSYLAPGGDRLYFRAGLQRPHTFTDSRRFADELLEEILGIYVPPPTGSESYEDYLQQAFAFPPNRARADSVFLSLMAQAARVWGTLLAMGAYADGESFAPRNVGLKSCWIAAEWKVQIRFMDHDCLAVPQSNSGALNPLRFIEGLLQDERFLVRDFRGRHKSSFIHLQEIYRVSPQTLANGQAAFRNSLASTHARATHAIAHDENVQRHFSSAYLRSLAEWKMLVCDFLQSTIEGRDFKTWASTATARLKAISYSQKRIDRSIEAIDRGSEWLQKYGFLYVSKYAVRSFS